MAALFRYKHTNCHVYYIAAKSTVIFRLLWVERMCNITITVWHVWSVCPVCLSSVLCYHVMMTNISAILWTRTIMNSFLRLGLSPSPRIRKVMEGKKSFAYTKISAACLWARCRTSKTRWKSSYGTDFGHVLLLIDRYWIGSNTTERHSLLSTREWENLCIGQCSWRNGMRILKMWLRWDTTVVLKFCNFW